MQRREFLRAAAGAATILGMGGRGSGQEKRRPNVVLVFADQWRAQATGYAGDENAITPNLNRLSRQSVNLANAVSGCPVCCPYRASLITGRYPLTHGVFMNDVPLSGDAVSLASAFKGAGYDTAYIGKWHVDGHGRSNFIPRERRQGFDYWKVLECTHDYNRSAYFGDEPAKRQWEGYDAIAQTRDAQNYIKGHAGGKPFLTVLSWGPPHDPYGTAPAKYRAMFKPETIKLRPNVPAEFAAQAQSMAAGYYAHIAALDDCVGELLGTLKETGIERDTIFIFTSDHGDMLGSHGERSKQRPWDESIRVPFLLRYPGGLGTEGKTLDVPIDAPDIMPTLLGLCGVEIPRTVEGMDLSGMIRGEKAATKEAALIASIAPFGQWTRSMGGKEYRGVRTRNYTYVKDMKGPWMLYDNQSDPHQTQNLCGRPEFAAVQQDMDAMLAKLLKERADEFREAEWYIKKWGYRVDKTGTVPYSG